MDVSPWVIPISLSGPERFPVWLLLLTSSGTPVAERSRVRLSNSPQAPLRSTRIRYA